MSNNLEANGVEAEVIPANKRGQVMPLAMFKAGERVRVAHVSGADSLRRHLGSLGFSAGTVVQIIDDTAGGKIVGIQGERLALNVDVAQRINCFPV